MSKTSGCGQPWLNPTTEPPKPVAPNPSRATPNVNPSLPGPVGTAASPAASPDAVGYATVTPAVKAITRQDEKPDEDDEDDDNDE